MKSVHRSQKMMLSALAGAIVIPGSAMTVKAAEETTGIPSPLPVAGM